MSKGVSMAPELQKLCLDIEDDASLPQPMSRALGCWFPTMAMIEALRSIHGA